MNGFIAFFPYITRLQVCESVCCITGIRPCSVLLMPVCSRMASEFFKYILVDFTENHACMYHIISLYITYTLITGIIYNQKKPVYMGIYGLCRYQFYVVCCTYLLQSSNYHKYILTLFLSIVKYFLIFTFVSFIQCHIVIFFLFRFLFSNFLL